LRSHRHEARRADDDWPRHPAIRAPGKRKSRRARG
jgi:hypothetical protein